MPANARFWRNLALIGLAHAALITGLVRLGGETKAAGNQNIVWMSGGGGGTPGAGATAKPTPKLVSVSTPPPQLKDEEDEDKAQPILATAKSEIQLPLPTPKPSPKATATPRPKLTPSPTPLVKTTPKHKPSPKPTPKPSPKKMVLAKAEPKPSPKVKPTPETKKPAEDEETKPEESPNEETAKTKEEPEASIAAKPTVAKGSGGSGARSGGGTIQSQFGWYGSMLHDRFYSEWAQPASVVGNAKVSAMARIRIERDGRISSFEIVRSSGNAAVDDSIKAAAKRVTRVDALPPGLGGDHYDVKINFELNSD